MASSNASISALKMIVAEMIASGRRSDEIANHVCGVLFHEYGITPTLRLVRTYYSQGGNQKIQDIITKFNSDIMSQARSGISKIDPAVDAAFNQVWMAACSKADQKFQTDREEMQREIDRISGEMETLRANLDVALSTLQKSADDNKSLHQQVIDIQAQRDAHFANEKQLLVELAEVRTKNEKLHLEIRQITKTSQDQLDANRQEYEAKVQKLTDEFDGSRKHLLMQMEGERTQWKRLDAESARQVNELKTKLNDQNSSFNKEKDRLLSENKKFASSLASAEAQVGQLRIKVEADNTLLEAKDILFNQVSSRLSDFMERRNDDIEIAVAARISSIKDQLSSIVDDGANLPTAELKIKFLELLEGK